jgi:hypothetical protein
MIDKQLEPDKEGFTGIIKHCLKVTEMQWKTTLRNRLFFFFEYYTGCPICAISFLQALAEQMLRVMSFLLLAAVDRMLHSASHTF